MTIENLGNHDNNSETTTAANKQRFHEQKDTIYTCFFKFFLPFSFSSVVSEYMTLLVVKSVALLKIPLTKQIKTCKVFPAHCDEQRYTKVDSLFLF